MRVVMIFLDGIGLGENTPANPFVLTATPRLRALLGGVPLTRERTGYCRGGVALAGLDAVLGVDGLPQSATGQAAIFTGQNAPRLLGRHLHGFPNRALRELLATAGIFGCLKEKGYSVTFLNAYRPPFFTFLARGLPGVRYSCSTLISYYAGLPFRSLEDIKQGRALYMDITNVLLNRAGYAVPQITPEEGGSRLAALSAAYDFSLFEFFLSDLAGHLASREEACAVIGTLDRFIGAAVAGLDKEETLLIVTSDHGNLEDLSHREHTRNPVPALLVGPEALLERAVRGLKDLTDILPLIQNVLCLEAGTTRRAGGSK